MNYFGSITGMITMISDLDFNNGGETYGCYKLIYIVDSFGNASSFKINPHTYFVDNIMLNIGDIVIGFYDYNAPVPYIYPVQYEAIVMAKVLPYQNVKVDYFNSQLISSDGSLQLDIYPMTQITSINGQFFSKPIENRILIVIYGKSTKSIPSITIPYRVIVFCREMDFFS